MTTETSDQWAQWMLQRRFGGNPQQGKVLLETLAGWRDQILQHAQITQGETILDVGCGDGLVAFGALSHVGTSGKVIFSDISQDLLEHCRALAAQMEDVLARCQFVQAAADDLSAIATNSVDVVTTRSVLIYVQAKQQALHEFYRVLKPGGRLSIFEPINRFCYPDPPGIFMGYDVTPVQDLASRVRAVFERIRSSESNPMLNFDERDLLTCAEQAGFAEIHLELHATVKQPGPRDHVEESTRPKWETFLKSASNPLNPALEEAMTQALSPQETEHFTAYLRPLVETMQGGEREALAYLWSVKR